MLSTNMTKICETDFFYDVNLESCQPCQHLCSGPEKQEGVCETNCKEFMEKTSSMQDSSDKYILISVSISLVVLLIIFIITIVYVVLRRKRKKRTNQLPTVHQQELQNINSQYQGLSPSETGDVHSSHLIKSFPMTVAKSNQGMTKAKFSVPSKQGSFVSHASSEYAFREDDRNSLNGYSELGSSLHSSVIESPSYYPGESKPFFQDLSGLLSGLNFVKSMWATDSGVNIGLSQEGFAINERCVRELLQALLPKHEANLQRVNIVTI